MKYRSLSYEQGQRLIFTRKQTRLTRRAFALRHGFSAASLQAWEEGRYKHGLSKKVADKLTAAFFEEGIQCSSAWLQNGVGDPPRKVSIMNLAKVQPPIKHYSKYKLIETMEVNHHVMQANQALVQAIKKNNPTKLKHAIQQGANAHKLKAKELYIVFGSREDTALHLAAEYSGSEIIAYLLELGLHPNVRNRHLDSPLHIACLTNNLEALKTLIEFDANIEAGSREGATPLIWAAYMGYLDCIEFLINKYAHINNTDFYGNTAVHWAAYNNQAETIRFLYRHGALLDFENYDNKTPIDWALQNGHKDALEALIDLCNIK